ncbi:hypothetical protein ACJX0J_024357, partial [Zea mays]
ANSILNMLSIIALNEVQFYNEYSTILEGLQMKQIIRVLQTHNVSVLVVAGGIYAQHEETWYYYIFYFTHVPVGCKQLIGIILYTIINWYLRRGPWVLQFSP